MGGVEKKNHRKAIWKDSADMGHYFERDAPLFRLQREPCSYCISQLGPFLPETSLTSFLVDFWRPKPWPLPWPSGVTHAAANLARNAQMLAKVGIRQQRTVRVYAVAAIQVSTTAPPPSTCLVPIENTHYRHNPSSANQSGCFRKSCFSTSKSTQDPK